MFLSKIYYLLQLGICPACVSRIVYTGSAGFRCTECDFQVNNIEIREMQNVTREDNRQVVSEFLEWRRNRS